MTLSPQHNNGIILLLFLLALVLNIMPLPLWAQDFRPQWLALVLIYWCMALPERVGVGTAWTLGLLQDAVSGALLGQHALSLSVMAFLTVRLHQRIRIFPLWQQALSVFVLLLVERLLSLWVIGATGQPTPSLWYWAAAPVGMLLWPWLYVVLRDVRRRFQVS